MSHFAAHAAPRWMTPLLHSIDDGSLHRTLDKALPPGIGPDPTKQSAVLMHLCGNPTTSTLPDNAAVLLTHRSPHMRKHSGQVAFPGGRVDATDRHHLDAALREAWEETGLQRNTITPIAQLGQVHIRVTGYPVTPILAYSEEPQEVHIASPAEVDDVFYFPLNELANPTNRLLVRRGQWRGPAFKVHDYLVWGFTAGVLHAVLQHAGWEIPWDRRTHYDLSEMIALSRNNEQH
ncbi:MAG: CoA pyrophosphatase [Corynebacterium sp.]|uniref:NUDIX hydrolase n=1 Tax=Corynebacterium sp. TaxID=1720 RepID=UPI0026DD8C6B|nr:CoA pyrophosphatase [Corynebacterium sp.]MDO4761940.1 CoA pyrophosphatase [Corynebacterium sp.]